MPSTSTRVAKNAGYLYVKMGITMFISLYTTRLILQTLGASDFGVFNIVGGAIAMLGFLNLSMTGATQRFMSYAEGAGDRTRKTVIFNVSVLLHLIVAAVAGLALLLAGHFFFGGVLNIPADRVFAAKVVYGSLIVSTLFTVMTVPYDAVLNSHENMRYYAVVGVLESVLKLGVAFACVYTARDRLMVYGVLMACIPLFTLSVMRVYCHRHYTECRLSLRRHFDRTTMREMAGFAGWNLMDAMVTVVSQQGYGILLNHFFGTLLNAAQGITTQFNGQLQNISSGMTKALAPVMDKSAGAHNRDLFMKSMVYGSKFTTALFLLVAIPVFLYAPAILTLWLKNPPAWTVVFVRFQLIATTIDMMCVSVPRAIASSGRIRKFEAISCLIKTGQLPLVYMAFRMNFPPYSLYVVSLVCGTIMCYAAALYCVRECCGLSPRWFVRQVIVPVSASVLLTLAVMRPLELLIGADTLPGLLILSAGTVAVFVSAFYLICCRKEERALLSDMAARVRNFRRRP